MLDLWASVKRAREVPPDRDEARDTEARPRRDDTAADDVPTRAAAD